MLLGSFFLAGPSRAAPLTLPGGFVADTLAFHFDLPTSIAFLPGGGILVAEKGGIVYVVRGNQRWTMWSDQDEVLNSDDRGLLAVAVDPNFVNNRRLYFLYTVDPDSGGSQPDNSDDAFARLVRYEVSAADSNTVDESTRKVLIGATWSDGFPSGSGSHTIAALEWGSDGSLLVSAGDGAHFEQMDSGGLDSGLFAPGRTDPAEDIGAFRSQDLGSLDGKILRVDPTSGDGYPSNPYFDGNPKSARSRVWAYGLRNPFRIARRPGTGSPLISDAYPGTLYVGDVGWNNWEELDIVPTPGLNFGWPCFEGFNPSSEYPTATPSQCGCPTLGTPENPGTLTDPLIALNHLFPTLSVPPGLTGGVIAGGRFYTGLKYPAIYRGAYFFGDYGRDWIRVLEVGPGDELVSMLDFATGTGRPVAFANDPVSGDLYYVAIGRALVYRIRYDGTTDTPETPVAAFSLSPPTPNPSRGAVSFRIELPQPARVRFAIYDPTGREVWDSGADAFAAGAHALTWPGCDRAGHAVRPGLYLARVEAGGRLRTGRVAVLR